MLAKTVSPAFVSQKILKCDKPRHQQCLVYKFECDLCDAGYVSYTSRHLHQRIEEDKRGNFIHRPALSKNISFVPLFPCSLGPLLPCCLVTLLLCSPVLLFLCSLVALLSCFPVSCSFVSLACSLVFLFPCSLVSLFPVPPFSCSLFLCFLSLFPCFPVPLFSCSFVPFPPPRFPVPCSFVFLACFLFFLFPCSLSAVP